MKKIVKLFCLFSLLTAFSCENEPLDDGIETGAINTEGLIGAWDLVEFSSSLSTSTNFEGQIIASEVEIESTTVDYVVNFTASSFIANGSYSYVTDIVANGVEISGEAYNLENVSGSGNYSTNGNEITIDGSFFEFEFEGMADTAAFEGEQILTFQISEDGQNLTFIQNEVTTETDPTTQTEITINNNSISVWTKL
ncbi:hypothetical protein [uncultured Winogradskyella sp.]|uniref:hypothetical protein n=1 Tax=uncultured Winogradskyella sp. TaxID=395353 RepID=UPI00261939A0|nr:hypothetical protein [uncultured Winogradskyella sp.]